MIKMAEEDIYGNEKFKIYFKGLLKNLPKQ